MLARLLYGLAGRLPLRTIKAPDGGPYLERYFLGRVPDRVPWIGGTQVYLHRFLASDPDRGLHNHPWRWARSLILCGGYWEERLLVGGGQGWRLRRPGRFVRLTGEDFHRIKLRDGRREVWSLFWHGRYVKPWGFLVYSAPVGSRWVHVAGDAAGGGKPWWVRVPRGRHHPERVPLGGGRP